MSRTHNEHRNNVGLSKPNKGKKGIIGKKWPRSRRRMKPMLGGKRRNYGKLTYDDSNDVPICYKTKSMKQEIKNANRSVKKTDRQSAKREIEETLRD